MIYPIRKLQLKPADLLLLMKQNPSEQFNIVNGSGEVLFTAHLDECVNVTPVEVVNKPSFEELKYKFDARAVPVDAEIDDSLPKCDKCKRPKESLEDLEEDGIPHRVCSDCILKYKVNFKKR